MVRAKKPPSPVGYRVNPILTGLLNTLQNRGAYFTPLLIRLFFTPEA